jgi:hypothetical protein
MLYKRTGAGAGLDIPVSAGYTSRTVAFGDVVQPSTANTVMVVASLEIQSNDAGDRGRIDVQCDAANPPTTIIATFRQEDNSQTVTTGRMAGPITFLVAPGDRYQFVQVDEAFTSVFSVLSVLELTL